MPEFVAQAIEPSAIEYPDVPTIFADGIVNLANSGHVAKFYLYRLDPNVKDVGRAQAKTCAQIVMPLDGLTNTFAFLEAIIEKLQKQGLVSEHQLAQARLFQKQST
jgi:hypothetical protein